MMCVLSRVQLFTTPWTVVCAAPLSMGFFRQEYWSGLSFPPPGDLPNPGIEPTSPVSPALQADSLPAEPSESWVRVIALFYSFSGSCHLAPHCRGSSPSPHAPSAHRAGPGRGGGEAAKTEAAAPRVLGTLPLRPARPARTDVLGCPSR